MADRVGAVTDGKGSMAAKRRPVKDQVIVIGNAAEPTATAIARAAARRGARLMLVGADEAALGEAARAINNAGGSADYAVATPIEAARAAVTRFGRIDSWIDAGSPDGWSAAAGALRERGGALVVVAADAAAIAKLRARPVSGVTIGAVRVDAAVDPSAIAEAVLAMVARPDRDRIVGGDPARRRGIAAYLPGAATTALGLGGLALAAGAVALLRRRRRA